MRLPLTTSLPRLTSLTPRLPKPNYFQYRIRTMASSTEPQKFEWLVVIPDKEGALEKRLAVRPQHFAGLTKLVEGGFFKMGGAMLNSVPVPNATPDFAGSCVIAYAATKEEILAVINEDPYAKAGVWDLEKMTIFPFMTAFREAKS